MKLINNMIFSLAALSLMTVSCAPEEVYTPGEKDQEGCLGVYFPPQELAGTSLDLDPTAPTTVTLTVARQVPDGEAVVPVEVTGDEVFEVDEISFEDGETETTFQVNFDTAEIGTKYSLSIKITDPAFASIYSLDAQGISFSVTRVKWNLLTGPAGENTGLLRDDCFAPMYGISNYEGPVTIYERDDVPGLYRCTPLYSPLFLANAFGYGPSMADQLKAAWFISDESTIIDATNPDKVWIPRQPLGLQLSSGDGAISILSCCKEAGFEGNYYGTLKDGVITFPKGGLAMTFSNATKDYQVNDNGLFRICLPGITPIEVDYSMTLLVGESNAQGQIPFQVQMGTDLAKVKVAAFEGTLNGSQVNAKVAEITAGTVQSTEITETGVYALSDLGSTGIYTLVAAGYNSDDKTVVTKASSFGYVAAGDEKPVIANVGLIVSDKYAPAGHTTMNSLEYYAYGQDVTEAYLGLYRKQDYVEQQQAVLKDLMKYPLTKTELAEFNSDGISDIYTGLGSGVEYVLVLYASNGYKSEVFVAEAATEGLPDPIQMDYTIEDIYLAEAKADYCKTWSFWAGTVQTQGRAPVGPVVVADAGIQTSQYQDEDGSIKEYQWDALSVKGIWAPVVEAGYLQDDTMLWEYYNGIIIPIHDVVGTYSGSELTMLSFFTNQKGGLVDGVICGGFTEDGNVAFVDMQSSQYEGLEYWFTSLGIFNGGEYQGDLIRYDEMMFVDPANVPAEEAQANARPSVQMMNGIKAEFNVGFNCVETLKSQLYNAIDRMQERSVVRTRGEKAGLDLEIPGKHVNCNVLPYNGKFINKGVRTYTLNF